MLGIIGIIALLTILGLSLFITRLATVALQMTGLSQDAAKFQARSAFTGTGFTTSEAEYVANHPVRRRIIMLLMILRSAGLLTIVMSLILSFVGTDVEESLGRIARLLWILAGVGVLWALSLSKALESIMEKLIQRALARWTDLEVRDYAQLLNLTGEYGVGKLLRKTAYGPDFFFLVFHRISVSPPIYTMPDVSVWHPIQRQCEAQVSAPTEKVPGLEVVYTATFYLMTTTMKFRKKEQPLMLARKCEARHSSCVFKNCIHKCKTNRGTGR